MTRSSLERRAWCDQMENLGSHLNFQHLEFASDLQIVRLSVTLADDTTTDRDGVITSHEYDSLHQLLETTRLGVTTRNSYTWQGGFGRWSASAPTAQTGRARSKA